MRGAGLVGVGVTLAVGGGLFFAVRRRNQGDTRDGSAKDEVTA
ncbi:hypothetical protein ACFQ08_16200 [Streptosporangium algeriense]|uniref:Gram-positive cocci surface proteins LPxTG domain-containing protein n=1 Tax=Streptosporangium algeriense TaxID=1682748 RepID=A0ABW3DSX9_9ACTN